MSDVTVKSEPLVYEPLSPHSYFGDILRAKVNHDERAQARLARHREQMAVEQRTAISGETVSGTGAGTDLALPLYLIDRYKTSARAGRPFADTLQSIPLPRGVKSINVPRLVSANGPQSTETTSQADLNALNETDPTTAINTSNVVSITGQLTVSQQVLEQSGAPGADVILFDELTRDYNTQLDYQLINGAGSSSNQLLGLANFALATSHYLNSTTTTPLASSLTTFSSSSSTDLWPWLGVLAASVGNDRGLSPEIWLMSPRRWFWIADSVDSSKRPIASPRIGADVGQSVSSDQPIGNLLGLPVIIDGNCGTYASNVQTSDSLFCLRAKDMYLFESEPMLTVNPDTSTSGNLASILAFHAYAAFVGNIFTSSIAALIGLSQPAGPATGYKY